MTISGNLFTRGSLLANAGRWDEARKALEQALHEIETALSSAPERVDYLQARAEKRILPASALRPLGVLTEELDAYRRASEDYEQLALRRPGIPSPIQQQAIALIDLGNLLQYLSRSSEAVEPLTQAIVALAPLAEAHGRPEYYEQLAAARAMLGEVYRDLGKESESEQLLRSALSIYEQLAEAAPDVLAYTERCAVTRGQLGQTLVQQEDAEAALMLQAGIRELDELSSMAPETPAYQHEAAYLHWHLAEALLQTDPGAAGEAFARAAEIWEQLNRSAAAPEYADSFARFLLTCGEQIEWAVPRALEMAQRAHQSQPSNWRYQSTLGAALYRAGQIEPAIAALAELVTSGHADAYAGYFLALALCSQGQQERARERWQSSQKWRMDQQPANVTLKKIAEEVQRLLNGELPSPKPAGSIINSRR